MAYFEERASAAHSSPLLRDMTVAERDALFEGLSPLELRDGDIVFEEGQPGDSLYVIAEGKIRIGTMIPGVGEEALTILNAGDFFGEMSLIDESPRSARAVAHGTAVLYPVSREHFMGLISREPACAARLLWNLCLALTSRLRGANEKIRSFFLFTQGF
jgi:CRP-like cAMP-binding protein